MTSKVATRWQLFNSQDEINQVTKQRILDAAKKPSRNTIAFSSFWQEGQRPKVFMNYWLSQSQIGVNGTFTIMMTVACLSTIPSVIA